MFSFWFRVLACCLTAHQERKNRAYDNWSVVVTYRRDEKDKSEGMTILCLVLTEKAAEMWKHGSVCVPRHST